MKYLKYFSLGLALALTTGMSWGNQASSRVLEINSDTEYEKLMESKNPVLIKFAADWCGVCTNIKEQFAQVAAMDDFKNITFACVNIDKAPEASKKNSIVGVPSFLYLENGQKKGESVGVRSLNAFNTTLAEEVRKTFNIASAK